MDTKIGSKENDLPPKAKIRWQCRRGMLELDILLISFFDDCYDTLSRTEQEGFVRLLEYPDPDLYHWLLHEQELEKIQESPTTEFSMLRDEILLKLLKKIKEHRRV